MSNEILCESVPILIRLISFKITEKHISEVLKLKDNEIDELVSTMIDIETVFLIYQKDPVVIADQETKQIYHYIFRLLRKGVAACSSPIPDFQTLGRPPYEDPCIQRAISALLAFRYGHVPATEWSALVDLGKILLHTINVFKLDVPSVVEPRLGAGPFEAYKAMYARYVNFHNFSITHSPVIFQKFFMHSSI